MLDPGRHRLDPAGADFEPGLDLNAFLVLTAKKRTSEPGFGASKPGLSFRQNACQLQTGLRMSS